MTLPTKAKTWTILPNIRSTYVSLNTVMGDFLYRTKEFLKTTMGYTVKGSSDGTTAAMDGVDRWTDATKSRTRGANTTSAQSWICITNGAGVDIVFAYNGTVDDQTRFLISPGGNFVAAGTATFQPTATDSVDIGNNPTSIILNTTSGDRVFQFFGTTDKKNFRVAIYRAGVIVYSLGVEEIIPTLAVTSTLAANTTGYLLQGIQHATGINPGLFGVASNGSRSWRGRVTCAGVVTTLDCSACAENFLANATMSAFANVFCNLQNNYMILPIGIASSVANAQGKLGNLIDWWCTRRTAADGDVMGTKEFIIFGACLWPWDGTTTPVLS